MSKVVEIPSGTQIGRLTVMSQAVGYPKGNYLCVCECGNSIILKGGQINSGSFKSCGCLRKGKQPQRQGRKKVNDYIYLDEHTVQMFATNTGAPFIIDATDLWHVIAHAWCENRNGYIISTFNGKTVSLSRYLLGLADHRLDADHIDRDRKNHRRSNLRSATSKQNAANRAPRFSTW